MLGEKWVNLGHSCHKVNKNTHIYLAERGWHGGLSNKPKMKSLSIHKTEQKCYKLHLHTLQQHLARSHARFGLAITAAIMLHCERRRLTQMQMQIQGKVGQTGHGRMSGTGRGGVCAAASGSIAALRAKPLAAMSFI